MYVFGTCLLSHESRSHFLYLEDLLGRDRVCGDEETKRDKCARETHGYGNSEQYRSSVSKKTRTSKLV